jgi:hypothetical protein
MTEKLIPLKKLTILNCALTVALMGAVIMVGKAEIPLIRSIVATDQRAFDLERKNKVLKSRIEKFHLEHFKVPKQTKEK